MDVNLKGAYWTGWTNCCTSVDPEHACFIRGSYDSETRLAETGVTIFRALGEWRRTDITFRQRFYPAKQILEIVLAAGFEDARCYDASRELGVDGPFSDGRGPKAAVLTTPARRAPVRDRVFLSWFLSRGSL